ncbi:hypothetical protein HHI36_018668 [Cryptolaemus montrouzieri]|uniref:C2 NT-type domain-containing protein n=1 Tax=Cryptolaemus montrouzieri TaxID=559131 RepID=A0ABD2P0S9_9CUCU
MCEVTNTVWAKKTSNTGPKVKFRKQYQCWTHGGKEIQKELLFDARKCKGTLDIKVLCDSNPSTRRKNKFIRLGLNVVVKINFIHLHKVDISEPLAFFVHNCESQGETTKQIAADERLPQLVPDMVPKILSSSSLSSNHDSSKLSNNLAMQQLQSVAMMRKEDESTNIGISTEQNSNVATGTSIRFDDPFIHEAFQMNNTLHVVQNVPLQTLNGLKLEFHQGLEQFAQVVVGDTSMNGSLLTFQPLLFDNTQALPHFMQLNSHSLCNQNQVQFPQ